MSVCATRENDDVNPDLEHRQRREIRAIQIDHTRNQAFYMSAHEIMFFFIPHRLKSERKSLQLEFESQSFLIQVTRRVSSSKASVNKFNCQQNLMSL